jgi:hypothetical protein
MKCEMLEWRVPTFCAHTSSEKGRSREILRREIDADVALDMNYEWLNIDAKLGTAR